MNENFGKKLGLDNSIKPSTYSTAHLPSDAVTVLLGPHI